MTAAAPGGGTVADGAGDLEASSALAAWIVAGALAGVLAGALDAGTAISSGIGGLATARAVRLVILAASLLAATGVLGGALVAALGGLLRRRVAVSAASGGAGAAAVALVAMFSLLVVGPDAFYLFAGPKASRIPAHGLLSLVLAALVAAAVFGLARAYANVLARARAGGSRARGGAVVLGLVLAAWAAHTANRDVLPRLYPWFHATLALVTLVLGVLATRLLLEIVRRRAEIDGRRARGPSPSPPPGSSSRRPSASCSRSRRSPGARSYASPRTSARP